MRKFTFLLLFFISISNSAEQLEISNFIWRYDCEYESCTLSRLSADSDESEQTALIFFYQKDDINPVAVGISFPLRFNEDDEFRLTWLNNKKERINSTIVSVQNCSKELEGCAYYTEDKLLVNQWRDFFLETQYFNIRFNSIKEKYSKLITMLGFKEGNAEHSEKIKRKTSNTLSEKDKVCMNLTEDICNTLKMWIKGAEAGDEWAQFNLGEKYSKGKGAPLDMDLAIFWYKKAASNGFKVAEERLNKINTLNLRE